MKILFLDQSGNLGGAELCLVDIAKPWGNRCLVALFSEGPFKTLLDEKHIPAQVLVAPAIQVRKESSLIQGLNSLGQLIPLILKVAQLSRNYDLIYANTQKALVVGAMASLLSRRPLVYHLHDILSLEHFSPINLRLAVTLANRFASLVIANSEATQSAFVTAGGNSARVNVVYNGFESTSYLNCHSTRTSIREQLGLLDSCFVIGHFSRLSPWKGQHVLIDALLHCPEDVSVILVGDALFGEQDYAAQLRQQVDELGLGDRVKFLGFCSDIPALMAACDLVAHTSIAPEPFGRVIVEAMLCQRAVVAASAGGAVELVEQGKTGWLCPPGDSPALAEIITTCRNSPEQAAEIAQHAHILALQRFEITRINQQIQELLERYIPSQVLDQT
jgi:glycosyltransferase involved in cell wall biosynthesis